MMRAGTGPRASTADVLAPPQGAQIRVRLARDDRLSPLHVTPSGRQVPALGDLGANEGGRSDHCPSAPDRGLALPESGLACLGSQAGKR